MSELKPCPFCGESPEIMQTHVHPGLILWYVACLNNDCQVDVQTFNKDTKQEAIDLWNTRIADRQ